MSQDKEPDLRASDRTASRRYVTLDELVGKGQSVLDRVKRMAERVRAQLARGREAK
jgi:hypothetical protein